MARLVRAQVLVRGYEITEENLTRLVALAEEAARAAGRRHFETPVKVNLDVGEGSLKAASVALGALFSAYYFVGNYKAFKEGVVDICHDANKYGDDFCDKFLKSVGVSKSEVVKKKVEVQTPARLREVLNQLEQLDNPKTLQELDSEMLFRGGEVPRLAHAASALDRALRDLDEKDKAAVLESLKFTALPPPSDWPREQELPESLRIALKPEQQKLFGPAKEGAGRGPAGPKRVKLRMRRTILVEPAKSLRDRS